MTTKRITTHAMSYLISAARRRQLSSGPLGGDNFQSLVCFRWSKSVRLLYSYRGSKGESSNICYKILNELPFYNLSIGEKMSNEKSLIAEIPKVTNNQARSSLGNFRKCEKSYHIQFRALHLELSPPNQVAQADGKYGVFFH